MIASIQVIKSFIFYMDLLMAAITTLHLSACYNTTLFLLGYVSGKLYSFIFQLELINTNFINFINKVYISGMFILISKRHVISFFYSTFIRYILSDATSLDTFEISFLHQSEEIKNHPNNPIPNFDEEEKVDDSYKYEAPVVTLWTALFAYTLLAAAIFYFIGPSGDDK